MPNINSLYAEVRNIQYAIAPETPTTLIVQATASRVKILTPYLGKKAGRHDLVHMTLNTQYIFVSGYASTEEERKETRNQSLCAKQANSVQRLGHL
ncbi:hypothetical protein VFPPC_15948 [Pochonia chlamydosporia 170]|uniref:Uncharacterized protein n=1 Tax=Pochonia chlamydosporia 170 TaxID=1380566 RepID=A0A179FJI3_METCM|nr:hypothetical protein VFPPC_15948 [Pochonia chlamydosporia 170]OAQ65795.1 hypothetical protein VFPPC_15948 [Pochonia chlamydosporia 170]